MKSWPDEKELEDGRGSELLEDELLEADDAEPWNVPGLPKSWLDEKELEDREGSELLEDELLEADDAELWDVLDDDGAGRGLGMDADEIEETAGDVPTEDTDAEDIEECG